MAAIDAHAGQQELLSCPADNAEEITPNDEVDLTYVSRGIYVGGAGDLVVTMAGGNTVTFYGVTAGATLPIRVTRVMVATSASNLLNLY